MRVKGKETTEEPLNPQEIRRGLVAGRLGKSIRYFSTIDSTNVYAQTLAQRGAPEGEIVIAEEQSGGKGRMGRGWVSPPFMNLYLSVILRPKLSPADAPQITLMGAVALAETVRTFVPDPVEIKWPNDILVGGKKLAGILTESSCERDRILFVILGIGVNLNFPREMMPEAIRGKATSILDLTRQPVDRIFFGRRLIQNLDQCYADLESKGFPSVAGRWVSFFHLKGKKVRVEMPDQSVSGKAMGIDRDGALLLQDERGRLQRILAGDVIPLEG